MIFSSQYEPVHISETDLTNFVASSAKKYGDKPALIDGPSGRTITDRQLFDAVNQIATGVVKQGFEKGDVLRYIAPISPNTRLHFLL